MMAALHIYLAFYHVELVTEPVELCMLKFVWE